MNLENFTYQFIELLQKFDYQIENSNRIWKVFFPDLAGEKWHFFHVLAYQNTFYIYHINGEVGSLEIVPNKSVEIEESFVFEEDELESQWLQLVQSAITWLEEVEKDWVQAHLRLQKEYPFKHRWGILPHSLVQRVLGSGNLLVKKLGETKAKEFVGLVERGFFSPFTKPKLDSMTAEKYFEYCKIAYLAVEKEVDANLSGKEMYRIYADGRNEGLLDIDPNSAEEFADWIDHKHPKRERGGHPWEIVRGGSYTHIGMRVQRPSYREEGFVVELYGHSSLKLPDTIKMFLAIHNAGFPIYIVEPQNIRKRLLGQDKVGIVPNYETLTRAEQHFDSEDVIEVMYYGDLRKHKKQLRSVIQWEVLPILKVRDF